MNRRRALKTVAAALAVAPHHARSLSAEMNTITAGPWTLETPSDWSLQRTDIDVPYLESSDGTKGCYIKAIKFGKERTDGEDAATYLQAVHERSFVEDPEASWKVAERSGGVDGQAFRSVLDLFDERKKYRVLSVVLATSREAFQVTIHDYLCESYGTSKQSLAQVASSLRGPNPGA